MERTSWSTTPLAMVLATAVLKIRKAMKLKTAAQTTASRGVRTRVATTVAVPGSLAVAVPASAVAPASAGSAPASSAEGSLGAPQARRRVPVQTAGSARTELSAEG